MDEIDSIGSSRIESGSGGDSEVQRTMLELLNQLDGFEATKNIKVCHGLAWAQLALYANRKCNNLKKCCTI
jgi:ATP-dependent 26S proteasome regulatory subunit